MKQSAQPHCYGLLSATINHHIVKSLSVSLSLCLCLSLSCCLFKFVLFFNYVPFEWLHPDIYSTVQKVCEVNDLDVGQVLAAAIHKWLLSPDTAQDADTVPHLSQYMFSWRWYPHAFSPVSQTFYIFQFMQLLLYFSTCVLLLTH